MELIEAMYTILFWVQKVKKTKNGPDEGRTRDLGVISTTL